MQISHVIRAEEHLANTARQLMLYDALGADAAAFAHVPLILNRDRTKMSKRSGEAAVAVGDWRARRLRAGGAAAAISRCSDSIPATIARSCRATSCSRRSRSSAWARAARCSTRTKLRWVNAHYLHHAGGARAGARGARRFLPAAARALPDAQRLEALLEAVRGNLATLADLPARAGAVPRRDADARARRERGARAAPRARAVCAALADGARARLRSGAATGLNPRFNRVGQRLGVKGRELFQPVRAALTGRTHGPELPLVAELLGGERCDAASPRAARARRARERIERMKVAVLMGGRSAEREISLRTGRGIAQALRNLGHEVAAIDAADGRLLPAGEEERGARCRPRRWSRPRATRARASPRRCASADVVFIALHGGAGENGTHPGAARAGRQALHRLGRAGERAGDEQGDVEAPVFEREGIPTPRWRLLSRRADARRAIDAAALGGYPLVVKPNEEGSTVGLTIVDASCRPDAAARRSLHAPASTAATCWSSSSSRAAS